MEATASEQNAMKQDVKSAQNVSTDGVSGLLESTIVMVTGHAAVSFFFFTLLMTKTSKLAMSRVVSFP
jgi:hypothetical protein